MAFPGAQGMHLAAAVSARGSITSTEGHSVAGGFNVYSIDEYEAIRVTAYFFVKIERHCLNCAMQSGKERKLKTLILSDNKAQVSLV